jgi:hypothetical protein
MPPSSDVRRDLLLEPGSSCGFSDGPVGGALGRELSPILSLCGRKRLGVHFASMGLSYTLMLSAFYVDNGKHLPLCGELPQWPFWVLPVAVGATIIIYVMLRHPLMRRTVAG